MLEYENQKPKGLADQSWEWRYAESFEVVPPKGADDDSSLNWKKINIGGHLLQQRSQS